MFESRDVFSGALTASIELLLWSQPLNYAKNRVQQGLPLSPVVSNWYRGVGINLLAVGFLTGFQLNTHNKLGHRLTNRTQAAIGSGITLALVQTPGDVITLNQQNSGENISTVARRIFYSRGIRGFWTGYTPVAMNASVFSVCYLDLAPRLQTVLQEHSFSPDTASLAAYTFTGIAAGTYCHPFDTIKTRMQARVISDQSFRMSRVIQSLWHECGWAGFYRGVEWRIPQLAGRLLIYQIVGSGLDNIKRWWLYRGL